MALNLAPKVTVTGALKATLQETIAVTLLVTREVISVMIQKVAPKEKSNVTRKERL